jgi:hypothetical protein
LDPHWHNASTIGGLKDAWSEKHARWSKRDLSAKRYVSSSPSYSPKIAEMSDGCSGKPQFDS